MILVRLLQLFNCKRTRNKHLSIGQKCRFSDSELIYFETVFSGSFSNPPKQNYSEKNSEVARIVDYSTVANPSDEYVEVATSVEGIFSSGTLSSLKTDLVCSESNKYLSCMTCRTPGGSATSCPSVSPDNQLPCTGTDRRLDLSSSLQSSTTYGIAS